MNNMAQAQNEQAERIAEILHRMERGMTTKQDAEEMAKLLHYGDSHANQR